MLAACGLVAFVRIDWPGVYMNDDERCNRIREEAARVHESATYSSETQFEYAKRWRSVDRWVGSVAAGLAAVAGVGGLSKVVSVEWAGTIAILSALIGAVSASIAARQTTEKATVSANLYRALQQDARIFMQIDLGSFSVEDARDALQKLVDRLQQLNRESVIPSPRAWLRAKRQIEAGAQEYEIQKT
jgi:hypothetical protein